MNGRYQETFKTWNKVAQLYETHFMDLDLYNDTYDHFCASLTKTQPSILEIGCGPGNITRYLKNQRPDFKITALDVSENMIQLAKKNNPEVDFRVMDCRDIHLIKNRFDAIICGFTIPYLSNSDCSKLISDCSDLLKQDGTFYLSFVTGDYQNSGYILGSTGDRTYFYYHDTETLKKELEERSFRVASVIEKVYQKAEGTMENHTIILAKKEE